MATPIYLGLPQYEQSAQRKLKILAPVLEQFDPSVTGAIQALDETRLQRGQAPLTREQTLLALQAAQSGQAVTPAPEPSPWDFFGNVGRDVRDLVTSIPRIPHALYEEARALPSLPQTLSDALGRGDVAGALQAPGVRLLPGTFVASSILGGQAEQLARHPVYTLLDVLPAAKPLGKAATKTAIGAKVARGGKAAGQALSRTKLGGLAAETFGKRAREVTRIVSTENEKLARAMVPGMNVPDLDPFWVDALRFARKEKRKYNISEERFAELTESLQRGDWHRKQWSPDEQHVGQLLKDEAERRRAYGIAQEARLAAVPEHLAAGRKLTWSMDQMKRYKTLQRQRDKANVKRLNVLSELQRQIVPHSGIREVDELLDLLQTDPAAAQRRAKGFARRTKRSLPFDTAGVSHLSTEHAKLAARMKRIDESMRRIVPAEMMPIVTGQVREQVQSLIDSGLHESLAHIPRKELAKIRQDAELSWRNLPEDLKPVWIPHVSPGGEAKLTYPKITEVVQKPRSLKTRTIAETPYVKNPIVAFEHDALEHLAEQGTVHALQQIGENQMLGARTVSQLKHEFSKAAEARATYDRRYDVEGHLEKIINEQYVPYQPEQWIKQRKVRLSLGTSADPVMIPKTVSNTLDRLFHQQAGPYAQVMDLPMKIFRTSVLPLSPRWQFNNFFGNLMMTAAEDPGILLELGKARRALKEGKIPIGVGTSVPREMQSWMTGAGTKMGTLFRKAMGERVGTGAVTAYDRVTRAGGKIIEASFDANAFVDDLFRSAAYLRGESKALRAGATTTEAQARGITLARKVLQTWDELTPIERSITRYVFPFYSWMRHITRYVMRYGADHPVRIEILSKLAKNEAEDWPTGYPELFRSAFFLGKPDKDGVIRSVQLKPLNPFESVANMFTLGGFVSSVNPILQTTLETMGVDTMQGSAELYPDLDYDPTTGRLVSKSRPWLSKLTANVIPQSEVISQVLMQSSEYKQLLRTNPDAAQRMLRSMLGVPNVFRRVNLPQEISKAEIARNETFRSAFNEAVRSGSLDDPRYPMMQPLLRQVAELQAQGTLAPFTPQEGQQRLENAQEALKRTFVP
jgi:hypothetical protein